MVSSYSKCVMEHVGIPLFNIRCPERLYITGMNGRAQLLLPSPGSMGGTWLDLQAGVTHGFTQHTEEAPRCLLAHVIIKYVLQRAASTRGQEGNKSKSSHYGIDSSNLKRFNPGSEITLKDNPARGGGIYL